MPKNSNRLQGEGLVRPKNGCASSLSRLPYVGSADLFPCTLPPTAGATPSKFSTATEAQRRRILEMLGTGRKTTLDFRPAGIMQSQTRIHELRARGYVIPTVGRVTIHDDQGYPHRGVAVYALITEPAQSGHVSLDALILLASASLSAGLLDAILRLTGAI